MDWGEAPKYNEAYRKIRWPHPSNGTFRSAGKPMWLSNIEYDIRLKTRGVWNNRTGNSRHNIYLKPDTRSRLMSDLTFCVSQNIPFKTKSLEYKSVDQYVYVYGVRVLKYDLETGCFSHFTYSGIYNKVTSLLLRNFDLAITRHKNDIVWRISEQYPTIKIDLNTIYPLVHKDHIAENTRGNIVSSYRNIIGNVVINHALFNEHNTYIKELNND
jgi:hypothetical protein